MQFEKNYLLPNNQYIHFHECDDGIDYTIYDMKGNEIDGGILECDVSTLKLEDVFALLSEVTGLKELLSNTKKEILDFVIEDLSEKNCLGGLT